MNAEKQTFNFALLDNVFPILQSPTIPQQNP